jgi:hypothetical protein
LLLLLLPLYKGIQPPEINALGSKPGKPHSLAQQGTGKCSVLHLLTMCQQSSHHQATHVLSGPLAVQVASKDCAAHVRKLICTKNN